MTGTETTHADGHDAHAVHPLTATIVALLVVVGFTFAFKALDPNATMTAAIVAGGLLGLFSLMWIWVLDRD